jgi:pimeloyl-ACP methyl ester carboxylesterase
VTGAPYVREEDLTLDGEVALLRAVLDELDQEKVVLAGGSSGGCAAITFAARFPERVSRLLLYGAYADGFSIASPEVRKAIVATVRSHRGLGRTCWPTSSWANPTASSRIGSRAASAPPRTQKRRRHCWNSPTATKFEQSWSEYPRRLWSRTAVLIARSPTTSAGSWPRRSRLFGLALGLDWFAEPGAAKHGTPLGDVLSRAGFHR